MYPLDQLIERVTINQEAVGLTPTFRDYTFLVWNEDEKVIYSNPPTLWGRTTFTKHLSTTVQGFPLPII